MFGRCMVTHVGVCGLMKKHTHDPHKDQDCSKSCDKAPETKLRRGKKVKANAVKYLGAYVCRTAIGDSRIVAMDDTEVTFRWKDRSDHDRVKQATIPGVEFVRRYLRHVLPRGLRSIRRYGFNHPAAKKNRERVQFHTGMPLLIGAPLTTESAAASNNAPRTRTCPCCGGVMKPVAELPRRWSSKSCRSRRLRAPPKLRANQDGA